MERRLAAILAADAVGFSRLMGADEAGTLAALKSLHKEIFAPAVAKPTAGRIVKLMGDGALVEFSSVVDAVTCAVAVQQAVAGRNAESAKPLELRIGVNLGDVMIQGADLFGDGVNVAARLQSLAAPGGIVLSATAHEHAAPKVDFIFEDGGEQTLKNIAAPLRVYHWAGDRPRIPGAEQALPLPDKPSIAVLPFDNMSADPEQEYFSDGITEDIITELSRFPSLFVIARNSTFSYKGKSLDLKQVARELGVHYILEGSIRRAGNRIRLTAQLIDGDSGNHLWAEKYDRDLEDVFAVQEEITGNVVSSIAPQIEMAEMARAQTGKAARFQSYDLALKAQAQFYDAMRIGRPELHQVALDTAAAALAKDPRCTPALWIQAWAQIEQYLYRWGDPDQALERAWHAMERLFEVDSSDPRAYMARSGIYHFRGDHDAAIADTRRAFEQNPNFAVNIFWMAWCESLSGLTREAKDHAALGLRLSPRDNELWLGVAYLALAQASFADGDHEETRKWAKLSIQMHGRAPIRRALMVACCAQGGDHEGAKAHAESLQSFSPDFASSILRGELTLYKLPEHNALLADGLRKAGLTD